MFCLVYFYIQPCSLKILSSYLTNAQPISFFIKVHTPQCASLCTAQAWLAGNARFPRICRARPGVAFCTAWARLKSLSC